MKDHPTRREFLATTAVAIPVAAASGASNAHAAQPPAARLVVPGEPGSPFSRATMRAPLAFVSGVLGTKPGSRELVSQDFEAQAKQVLENLKASVEAAGATMASVLKCTCYLTDASDFAAFNKVYVTFFPEAPPARSTVIVKALVLEGAKVEVDCVAALF